MDIKLQNIGIDDGENDYWRKNQKEANNGKSYELSSFFLLSDTVATHIHDTCAHELEDSEHRRKPDANFINIRKKRGKCITRCDLAQARKRGERYKIGSLCMR